MFVCVSRAGTPVAFSVFYCKWRSCNMQPSVWVLMLSPYLQNWWGTWKKKRKNKKKKKKKNFSNSYAQPPAQGKEGFWISISRQSHFSKTMPKACFQFSSSDRLLVGRMPVWRDAIYVAELITVFYLVYICTSYWVRLLASVKQHSSVGFCDFHSSESGIFFIFNVCWLSNLLKPLLPNLRCCQIHCFFAVLLWLAVEEIK